MVQQEQDEGKSLVSSARRRRRYKKKSLDLDLSYLSDPLSQKLLVVACTIVDTKNLSKLYKTRANLDYEYSTEGFADLDFAHTSHLSFFPLSKPRKVKIANGSFDIVIDYVEVRLVINYYIEIIKLFITKLGD